MKAFAMLEAPCERLLSFYKAGCAIVPSFAGNKKRFLNGFKSSALTTVIPLLLVSSHYQKRPGRKKRTSYDKPMRERDRLV